MSKFEQPVFIDPTTDEGFKRLFGDKTNLINFLNIIFRGRKTIVDLAYRDTERVGATEEIGTVIFDLMVETSSGEEIIVEMQTSRQANLKKRMLYYASKVIADKAPNGNRRGWAYAIPEVYTIVLMDGFHMSDSDNNDYLHDICLCSRDSGDIFYEGFGFIYLEIINFVKSEAEVKSELDALFFMLKNMSTIRTLPRIMDSGVFKRFFQLARYAKLSKEQREMYDISLKRKWDAEAVRQAQEEDRLAVEQGRLAVEEDRLALEEFRSTVEKEYLAVKEKRLALEKDHSALLEDRSALTQDREALEQSRHEIELSRKELNDKLTIQALETASAMKKAGLTIKQIAQFTNLNAEEIQKL